MRFIRTHGLAVLAHLLALLPLMVLLWDFAQGQLTANPIREVQLRTGKQALLLLMASLACRPFYIITGIRQVLPLRRISGLYAFLYVSLHFLNFLVVDYRFDFPLIREDLFEKRYAVVGFAAFLVLLPLAVTATAGWMRRLGKNWKRLHRLVYLAAVLAIVHFLWQTKIDFRRPLVYGAILVLLLVIRIPAVSEAVSRPRRWLAKRQRGRSAEARPESRFYP
ncbi:MAG: sulfoxide reductase heme-binding subunit YedZ [Chloroflexi bacterium]|nr:sulfoxide reductase heme-binding subunit YedZ [Chloroflexota bacterium]